MNKKTKLAIGSLILLAAPLAFACDYPNRPAIPDGNMATKDEMIAAKGSVNTYIAGVDEYLTCIEADWTAAKEELENSESEDEKRGDKLIDKKFDAANDEKALVGEEFNQQVRAYNNARKAAQ
ncbi:MAG: hypothetical protein IIA07_02400 [Proteobacteria bacterium]|nr:hypothetical protein [Pseudomonadota bacterium]